MICVTIDDNLDRIRSDLVRRGLTYDPLMDDLLDHVCCLVEEGMNEGGDFESTYSHVLDSIGEKSLHEIQHRTLLNLDRKFQNMKKYTYIIGLSAALLSLVAALFKKLHWPGAGVLIALAVLVIVGVFLPMYFIVNHREQSEKKNPVYAIVGYFTLAVLIVSILFKIMHWPGANMLMQLGFAVLIIGFVPLYVVNAFQKAGKEQTRLPYIVMLLLGISLVVLISSVRMSGYAINLYLEDVVKTEQYLGDIDSRTGEMIKMVSDSGYVDKRSQVLEIHDQAEQLQGMVARMRGSLLESVGQSGAGIGDMERKDIRMKGWIASKDYDFESEFMLETLKFKALLDQMFMDPLLRAQLDDHLAFAAELWPYEFGARFVVGAPFIINYHMLAKVSKGLALSEYLAVEYLVTH